MPEYDDATLERIMREGLELHAGGAAEGLDGPLPIASRRRPQVGRWLAVAAVLVLLTGGGVALRSALDGAGGPGRVATDPGGPMSRWRVESYAGVSLRVPPSWGLGGSPGDLGAGLAGTTVCADDPGSPYVGRPVFSSDMCVRWRPETGPYPTTDAVWFASPLPVGTTEAAGRQAVTRAVGVQDVTVFTDDATLRGQILGTLRQVTTDGNGCPSVPVRGPIWNPQAGRVGVPTAMAVCVYTKHTLLWSGRVGKDALSNYSAALQRTSATYDPGACHRRATDGTRVELGLLDAVGSATRWDVVDFTCQRIDVQAGPMGTDSVRAPLVPATVEPWASAGIQTYVTGPTDPGNLAPYFRGMLG